MPAILIFRERLLASSETFIAAQASALRRYQPVLTGLRRTGPGLDHSLPQVLLRGGCGPIDKLAASLYREVPIAPAFHRALAGLHPAAIHAHFAVDAVQAIPIARKLNLPLIVSLHGFDVTSSDRALCRSFAGRHFVDNRRHLFQQASVFLCVSEFIRDAAVRAGFPPGKLRVLYTGIDCERFCPVGVERDPKLVLFVGRLVEKKGCEYLLRAMETVQRHQPHAHVEIIGDGPLRPQLEALAATLRLHVNFRGVQNSDEVLRSMRRARVLCNPSVTAADGDMEGFGMVFAEAQAVGTPVVSFASAAIPEAVEHGKTGLLCPEKQIGPLAQCLQTYLTHDALWAASSAAACRRVRDRFDIANQTRQLESIYDQCIEQHRGSQPVRARHPPRTGVRIGAKV
jgi:glycosyltransferase involved in cell wall biosynthesis